VEAHVAETAWVNDHLASGIALKTDDRIAAFHRTRHFSITKISHRFDRIPKTAH
jgi:macrodomain Ter protein organizer (MatP/YcbG family)